MTARELFRDVVGAEWLDANAHWTVDKIKIGDENITVTKVGTCLTATPDVIRAAGEWGAELLITHEPTFYNHIDEFDEESRLCRLKKQLIEENNLTIYRYHDAMHLCAVDLVNLDFINRMGWKGNFDNNMVITLDEPIEIADVVRGIKKNLGLKNPRVVGATEGKVSRILLLTGHRGGGDYRKFSEGNDFDMVIGGELCEWADAEHVRDAAQFGEQKTLLILGHAGSEKSSMETLAFEIDAKYENIEARYFECGELYSYID